MGIYSTPVVLFSSAICRLRSGRRAIRIHIASQYEFPTLGNPGSRKGREGNNIRRNFIDMHQNDHGMKPIEHLVMCNNFFIALYQVQYFYSIPTFRYQQLRSCVDLHMKRLQHTGTFVAWDKNLVLLKNCLLC